MFGLNFELSSGSDLRMFGCFEGDNKVAYFLMYCHPFLLI